MRWGEGKAGEVVGIRTYRQECLCHANRTVWNARAHVGGVAPGERVGMVQAWLTKPLLLPLAGCPHGS